jgi:hypothetical protein
MIRLKATFLLLCIILILTSSKTSAQDKIPSWQFNEDAHRYIHLLKKYYSGLYHYEHENQFNIRIESLKLQNKDSITILEAYKKLAEFNAGLQDLHMALGLPKGYFGKETKVIPFIFRRFDHDFFIAYNQSIDSTLHRGTQILEINGKHPLEHIESFKTILGTDFNNEYSKNYYTHNNFAAYFNRWNNRTDSVTLKYQSNDTIRTKTIALLSPKETQENFNKRYKNSTRKNFDFQIVDSLTQTGKLDILSFRGPKSLFSPNEGKYKRQLKNKFKNIQQAGCENLILDLRGNGGGAVVNVHRLVSYLVSEPFRIYDTVSISKPGFKKAFKPYFLISGIAGRIFLNKKTTTTYYRDFVGDKPKYKPAKRYNFTGNLYVLMDGGSYSATTFTISLLKNMNRGKFIGTPPGGADWGSFAGVFHNTKLPHSKIQVRVPLMKLMHSTEGKTDDHFFVQPDYWLGYNMEDFLNRKDTYVEFVKMLVKNERN